MTVKSELQMEADNIRELQKVVDESQREVNALRLEVEQRTVALNKAQRELADAHGMLSMRQEKLDRALRNMQTIVGNKLYVEKTQFMETTGQLSRNY